MRTLRDRLIDHEPTAMNDRPNHEGGDPIIACECGWKQDWQHTKSWLEHFREATEREDAQTVDIPTA